MYKAFILEMINHAIEKEFNFICQYEANTRGHICIKPSLSDQFDICFYFETIFENAKVYGFIRSENGSVDWEKDNNYKIMKEYYSK